MQVVSVMNDGNVALRQLQLAETKWTSIMQCQPDINSTLPVGAVMTCLVRRLFTAEDFELGTDASTYQLRFTTSNIVPAPNLGSLAQHRIFLPNLTLTVMNVSRFGDLSVRPFQCNHFEYAGGFGAVPDT